MSKVAQEIESIFLGTKAAEEATLSDAINNPKLFSGHLKHTIADLMSGYYATVIWTLHTAPIENAADRLTYMAAFFTLIYMLDVVFRQNSYQKTLTERNQAIRKLFVGKVIHHSDTSNNFVAEENKLEDALQNDVLFSEDRQFLKIFHVLSSFFLVTQLVESTIDKEFSLVFLSSIFCYIFTRLLLQDHHEKEAIVRKQLVSEILTDIEDSNLAILEEKLGEDVLEFDDNVEVENKEQVDFQAFE